MISEAHHFVTENLACVVLSQLKPDESETGDQFSIVPKRGVVTGIQLTLSDGCSDSLFGNDWAAILAAECATFARKRSPTVLDLTRALPDMRERHRPIPATNRERRRLVQEGDFATLLVTSVFWERSQLHVSALGIGDTCVVLFEPSSPPRVFPVDKNGSFGGPPPLLWSKAGKTEAEQHSARLIDWGPLDPNSLIAICSDEVARWLLAAMSADALRDLFPLVQDVVRGKKPLQYIRFALPNVPPVTDDLTLILCTTWDHTHSSRKPVDRRIQLSTSTSDEEVSPLDEEGLNSAASVLAASEYDNAVRERICQCIDQLLPPLDVPHRRIRTAARLPRKLASLSRYRHRRYHSVLDWDTD